MNCQQAQQDLLSADDLDAELALRPELAHHLEACPACAALAAKIRRLAAAASKLPAPPSQPPADFLRRIEMIAPAPEIPVAGRLRFPMFLRRAIAAMIIVAAGLAALSILLFNGSSARANTLFSELVDWNIQIAQSHDAAARSRLYQEHLSALQGEIAHASLSAEDRSFAENLLANANWLTTENDPIQEAEHFVGIAHRLLDRMNAHPDLDSAHQLDRMYREVLSQGVQANIHRVDPRTLQPAQRAILQKIKDDAGQLPVSPASAATQQQGQQGMLPESAPASSNTMIAIVPAASPPARISAPLAFDAPAPIAATAPPAQSQTAASSGGSGGGGGSAHHAAGATASSLSSTSSAAATPPAGAGISNTRDAATGSSSVASSTNTSIGAIVTSLADASAPIDATPGDDSSSAPWAGSSAPDNTTEPPILTNPPASPTSRLGLGKKGSSGAPSLPASFILLSTLSSRPMPSPSPPPMPRPPWTSLDASDSAPPTSIDDLLDSSSDKDTPIARDLPAEPSPLPSVQEWPTLIPTVEKDLASYPASVVAIPAFILNTTKDSATSRGTSAHLTGSAPEPATGFLSLGVLAILLRRRQTLR